MARKRFQNWFFCASEAAMGWLHWIRRPDLKRRQQAHRLRSKLTGGDSGNAWQCLVTFQGQVARSRGADRARCTYTHDLVSASSSND